MCGVIGYHSEVPLTREAVQFVEQLIIQSKVRGLHATGIAYLDPSDYEKPDDEPYDIAVYKDKLPADEFVKSGLWRELMNEYPPQQAVIHTRYSTSGDWRDNENNQPLTRGYYALVHNGLISMATKPEFEAAYAVECYTANDSEILLNKIVEKTLDIVSDDATITEEAITAALDEITLVEPAIYACCLLTGYGEVFGFRDKVRPLWMWDVPALNLKGFCSTRDIFELACFACGITQVRIKPCVPHVVYKLAYTIQ
jgi:glutamine phosphoribosylpyrophosphate amidotransferase